ncbi:MAG TPA: biopolymer transporter ExbD [Candidatus Syntrophosphaera sp.]|nr:biopolymer transporter ExbD [Candidatus Syntrophosphaera sp.]
MRRLSKKEEVFNRKVRRKFQVTTELSITSLVDVLTILLVFLIKNVTMEVQKITMPNNMRFPVAMAKHDLLQNKGTTIIQVYPDKILIGEPALYFGTLEEFTTNSAKRAEIQKYLRLTASQILEVKDEQGKPKTPTALLIQADRSIPCYYITELVRMGTRSYYDYIYFATLLESDWLIMEQRRAGG